MKTASRRAFTPSPHEVNPENGRTYRLRKDTLDTLPEAYRLAAYKLVESGDLELLEVGPGKSRGYL